MQGRVRAAQVVHRPCAACCARRSRRFSSMLTRRVSEGAGTARVRRDLSQGMEEARLDDEDMGEEPETIRDAALQRRHSAGVERGVRSFWKGRTRRARKPRSLECLAELS